MAKKLCDCGFPQSSPILHEHSRNPEPKFKVGEIAVMKSMKRNIPFRILGMTFEVGEWFYQWNRRNYAAEHMLRKQTTEEKGD